MTTLVKSKTAKRQVKRDEQNFLSFVVQQLRGIANDSKTPADTRFEAAVHLYALETHKSHGVPLSLYNRIFGNDVR